MWGTSNPVVLKEVRTNLMLTGGLVHVEGTAIPLVTQTWHMWIVYKHFNPGFPVLF